MRQSTSQILRKSWTGFKFISPGRNRLNYGKLVSGNEATSQGLQHTTNSDNSIKPFERSEEVNFGKIANKSLDVRPHIRISPQQFHGELSTGDYSAGEEV
ncbi:hypothetical protein H5410_050945 [Solanum commersonii]|uniref:Uncharacterized protein n=1 Tax=Solanum commersonii TaxID=4109 RepID=A0A9J5WZA3_SOLCO|nr:hypothetical protein H5410_050945 [Solanum commersonii]